MKKFWNWKKNLIRNEETGEETVERVLELYGTIAEESWFDDDITPAMFREELFAGNGPVTIWIFSRLPRPAVRLILTNSLQGDFLQDTDFCVNLMTLPVIRHLPA